MAMWIYELTPAGVLCQKHSNILHSYLVMEDDDVNETIERLSRRAPVSSGQSLHGGIGWMRDFHRAIRRYGESRIRLLRRAWRASGNGANVFWTSRYLSITQWTPNRRVDVIPPRSSRIEKLTVQMSSVFCMGRRTPPWLVAAIH